MCGLAGELKFDRSQASSDAVERMLSCMESRGPDGSGFLRHGPLAFGHRRLKIIDLSDHAQQPMVDSELGLSLVFNGCIYNYKELRTELEEKGYRFFSTSDTEVILKAFHQWGEECVQRFNGMFACAIWSRDKQELYIFRDRLGIKPLYYAEVENGIRFASSLPALVKSGGISSELDPEALNYYLSFHSVVPAPLTILKSVRKLPQACWLKIDAKGSVRMNSYWSLTHERSKEQESWGLAEWKEALMHELQESVRRRTVADVPVGVLLSGGLDSSLVVGLLSKMGQKNIETFSIGFESSDEEAGDEFQYSDIIAKTFATKHHKLQIGQFKLLDELEACIKSQSEPMVSHDNIGFYLLSKEVAKHVKVVQSGQGADEVFAGYHWYPPMADTKDPVATYKKHFFDRDFDEMKKVLQSSWVQEDYASEFISKIFEENSDISAVDRALLVDTNVMLVDDPVKRVDNMTMAWGLEARVPFLDHSLVEFAAKIPYKYKLPEEGKYILKEVGREIIPSAVIDRPKGYFPVPQLKYIRGETLSFVKRILDPSQVKKRGVFSQSYIDDLMKEPEAHITPLRGSKLWQIALLEYWLQCHDL